MTLGVILTTSLPLEALGNPKDNRLVDTPFGLVEQQLLDIGSQPVAVIRRSSGASWFAPHDVNYRANMFAFWHSGVTQVIATNIVGALHKSLPPGSIVLPDQFLDFTRQRAATVFDRYGHRHVDVTEPFCPRLRDLVLTAAIDAAFDMTGRGTYVTVEGPRYETRAEVEAFARLGGDVVGMTCATEAIMARELGLCYSAVALVSNFGAGIAVEALDAESMLATAKEFGAAYRSVVQLAVAAAAGATGAGCCSSPHRSTQPSWRETMLSLSGSPADAHQLPAEI